MVYFLLTCTNNFRSYQLRFIILPNQFGVCMGVSFLNGDGVHPFFWTNGRERSKSTLRKYFKEIAWPFLLTSFFLFYIFSLGTFTILCGAKCGYVDVYSTNDHFFIINFTSFFHYVVHTSPILSLWFVTLHLWSTFEP